MAERPVPIIVISAYSDETTIALAREAGASGFEGKPIGLDKFGTLLQYAFVQFDKER